MTKNNPTANGRINPFHRTNQVINYVGEIDGSFKRAYPIGHYFADKLGGIFVPMDECSGDMDSKYLKYGTDVLKESSEAVEAFRIALYERSPGKITKKELTAIKNECREGMTVLYQMMMFAEELSEG